MPDNFNIPLKFNRYFALAAITLALLVIIIAACISGRSDSSISDCESGWKYADGESADLNYFEDAAGTSVFLDFADVESGKGLFFSSRNMFVDVYQDGKLISSDDRYVEPILGKSPGTNWHFVLLIPSESKTTIELKVYTIYSHGFIQNMYYGEFSAISQKVLSDLLFSFIFSSFWVFLSALLILLFLFLNSHYKFGREFLYFSIGALLASAWCSVETNIWQLLIGNSAFFHFIGYIFLIGSPVPFSMMAASRSEGIWKKAAEIHTFASLVASVIMISQHVFGIAEFHYTIWMAHTMLILCIPLIFKVIVDYGRESVLKMYKPVIIFLAGLVGVSILVGVIAYVSGSSNYFRYISAGLILFIFVMFIYQFGFMNAMIIKSMRSELEHDQAIKDPLTKLYNRAGLLEHRGQYEKDNKLTKDIGIVQFDVNNLKQVNDNLGHERGDELICMAAKGICDSFGDNGKCYRMGGDEFLVILEGTDIENAYNNGIVRLQKYCDDVNSREDKSFELHIAEGFRIARRYDGFSEAMEDADSKMYMKKRKMKGLD